jgi:cyclophilin family peptidyl-prolyl cis-trans isomerase
MQIFKKLFVLLFIFSFSFSSLAADKAPGNPSVIMHTTEGDITIELFPKEAPITVANFLKYVEDDFYNDTIFHRVIKRFVIQGGGFNQYFEKKETRDPIINEADNGLHNDRWTLSMARTNDPDSATSQFFINLSMNTNLDKKGKNPGYAVFAQVTDGFDVIGTIAKTTTRTIGAYADVPTDTIFITSVEVVKSGTEEK